MLLKRLLTLVLCFSLLTGLAQAAQEKKDESIESIMAQIYQAWNAHDLEGLFKFYSKSFVTGDGIKLEDYKELTKNLWESYPGIKIENQKRTIRSQDQYATISGIDFFYGESKDLNKELNKKGLLNAISQGQIFFRKYGKSWRIVSDRIHFELVTVYYGNAKNYLDEHQIYFSSPEQVKADEQYSATLYFVLPENIKATATINKELIIKPSEQLLEESFQNIKEHKLERLFKANNSNHNELVSSTIILSKGVIEPRLDGILYISKRVNVAPKVRVSKSDLIVDNAFANTLKQAQKDLDEDQEDSDDKWN